MSVEKWQQLAEEKTVLDKQTEEIHQKLKMNEINEFGQSLVSFQGRSFLKKLQKGLMKRAAPLQKKKKKKKRRGTS